MSREIKFSLWDKAQKKWLIEEFSMVGECMLMGVYMQILNDYFPDRLNDLVLVQYTGRRDKNGKKIYEGDIIKLCKNKNGSFRVEFRNAYVGGWVLTHPSTNDWVSLGARKDYEIEIIGNILEVPELLGESCDEQG